MKFGQKGTASSIVIMCIPLWLLCIAGCSTKFEMIAYSIFFWLVIGGFAFASYWQYLGYVVRREMRKKER